MEVGKAVATPLAMVLLARNAGDLAATKALVLEVNAGASVSCVAGDLGDLGTLDATLDSAFESGLELVRALAPAPASFQTMLFSNAASLGGIHRVEALGTLASLRASMDFNVTSALWTTKRFVHFARAHCEGAKKAPVLVNISSLAALVPFPSMANYCAAKAAKDAFTKVVGAEHTGAGEGPSAFQVTALNYAPGPMETEMNMEIMLCPDTDPAIRAAFAETKAKRSFVKPSDSARLCVQLALSGEFEPGAHVDYYDVCDK